MNLGAFLIKVVIGFGITLFLSFLCKKFFPRFTKRSKTNFDDFVLNALADSLIPLGIVIV